MKCKICGHQSRTLAAMASHYRKNHPKKMRRGVGKAGQREGSKASYSYCPHCGKRI